MSVWAPPCWGGRPAPEKSPKVTAWLPSMVWFTVMSQLPPAAPTLFGSQSSAVPAKRTLPDPRMPTVATRVFIMKRSRLRAAIIFWRKDGAPRERVLPLDTVDIAPTIAAVTGVKPPADVDGVTVKLWAAPVVNAFTASTMAATSFSTATSAVRSSHSATAPRRSPRSLITGLALTTIERPPISMLAV